MNSKRPVILSYAMAFLSVALAALLNWWLWPWLERTPSVLFVGAVVFSAWYGGLYPALVAGVLAAVGRRLFIAPDFDVFGSDDLARISILLALAWLTGWLFDERRRALQDLAAEREWLQVTLRSIGDALIATDRHGRVSYLNPVAETMTGWRSAEAMGQPIATVFNIINEETLAPAEIPVERVLREGRVVGLANHTALISRDGTVRAIEDSAAPIRDSSGNVLGVVMVFHDVTQVTKQERQLRASRANLEVSERRMRTLLDALPVGVAFSEDPKCLVATPNPVLRRQFEFLETDNPSASAVQTGTPGRQIRYFQQGRELTPEELPLQRAVAENRIVQSVELEVVLPSGKRWWAEVWARRSATTRARSPVVWL